MKIQILGASSSIPRGSWNDRLRMIAFALPVMTSVVAAQTNQPAPPIGNAPASEPQSNVPIREETVPQYSKDIEKIEGAIKNLRSESDRKAEESKESREIEGVYIQRELAVIARLMLYPTWLSTVLSFIASIGVIITVYYTRKSANLAQGMLAESQKATQAASDSARAAQDAVTVALESGAAQLDAAQRTFDLQRLIERPWVSFVKLSHVEEMRSVNGRDQRVILIDIHWTNPGKVPSHSKSISAKLIRTPYQSVPFISNEMREGKAISAVHSPAAEWSTGPWILTHDQLAKARDEEISIYIWTEIKYATLPGMADGITELMIQILPIYIIDENDNRLERFSYFEWPPVGPHNRML